MAHVSARPLRGKPPARKLWRHRIKTDPEITEVERAIALEADSEGVNGFIDFADATHRLGYTEDELFSALDRLTTRELVDVRPDGFVKRRYPRHGYGYYDVNRLNLLWSVSADVRVGRTLNIQYFPKDSRMTGTT